MQVKVGTEKIKADPYAWPLHGALFPENTALVLIDMQRDCTCHEAEIIMIVNIES